MQKIDKTLKYADNPRQITDDQLSMLKKHLETLGDLSGVVYCTKNKAYLGGNMRSEIMDGCEIEITQRFDKPTPQKTLAHGFITFGGEKFAYREVAFTKEEFKQACIVANSNGGTWDWEVLASEQWIDLPLQHWGIEITPTLDTDLVDKLNRMDEWIGMPDFEAEPSPFQIIVSFDTEDAQREFAAKYSLKFLTQGPKTWSTWYPFKAREDLASLRYD